MQEGWQRTPEGHITLPETVLPRAGHLQPTTQPELLRPRYVILRPDSLADGVVKPRLPRKFLNILAFGKQREPEELESMPQEGTLGIDSNLSSRSPDLWILTKTSYLC